MTISPSKGFSAARENQRPRAESPPILITGGDPAGIGPELVHALAPQIAATQFPIVYFSVGGAAEAHRAVDLFAGQLIKTGQDLVAALAADSDSAKPPRLVLSVCDHPARPGAPDEASGATAFQALKQACDLALLRRCGGIVTAPISKEWIGRSGREDFTGHTGYLAERFGCTVLMLMHGEQLSVIPLTIHLPLRDVGRELRRVLSDVELPGLLASLAERVPFRGTTWALCGLNPHAGEGGLLGTEEQELLQPVLEGWRRRGLPIEGPVPADAAFLTEARSRYRLILGCYHDQVLTPFKALEGRRGINVTIGLPLMRTSPDHGTAYELAGSGEADPESMRRAFAFVEENLAAAESKEAV